MNIKTTLAGAALSAHMILTGCAGAPQKDDAPEPQEFTHTQTTKLFFSERTYQTYKPIIDLAAQVETDLNALIITAGDLTHEDLEPYEGVWGEILNPCEQYYDDPAMEELDAIIEDAHSTLSRAVWELADSNQFVLKSEMEELARENPGMYASIFTEAAAAALYGSQSAISLDGNFEQITTPSALIMLKDEIPRKTQMAADLASLPPDHIKNISGSDLEWMGFVFGHEVFGHADNAHGAVDDPYPCTQLNKDVIARSNYDESIGDIKGAEFHAFGQKTGVFPANSTVREQAAAMRAMSAFFGAINDMNIWITPQAHIHITNVIYDPEKPDFISDITPDKAVRAFEITSRINTAADIVAAYVANKLSETTSDSEAVPAAATENTNTKPKPAPGALTKSFEGARTPPNSIADNMHGLSSQGLQNRFAENGIASHYAAMVVMKERGILGYVKAGFDEGSFETFDDLVNDFFDAVEKHGTEKVINPEIIEQTRRIFTSTAAAQLRRGIDFVNQGVSDQVEAEVTPQALPEGWETAPKSAPAPY